MPHRTHRRHRHVGRVLALSVLGWALFSRTEEERAADQAQPGNGRRVLDFDELGVEWDIPDYDPPAPAPAADSTKDRPDGPPRRRRLATTLVFATLFFAGAALSAGAGDMVASALDSTGSTATETATEATSTVSEPSGTEDTSTAPAAGDEGTPADPGTDPADDPVPSDGGSDGPAAADDGSAADPGVLDDGSVNEDPAAGGSSTVPADESGTPPADGSAGSPADGDGAAPDDGGSAASESDAGQGGKNGHAGQAPQAPAGPPVLDSPPSPATDAAPPDPEVAELGTAATIWLHRTLPDPTPLARRLAPRFARTLEAESDRAHADWALVLGVLRAEGRVGRRPAGRAAVRSLAGRLVALGARHDEWKAVAALRGRTAFADRSVALARYNRAVGLRALVIGLRAAKPALERSFLSDSRISVYAGGRSDIVAHRIDVRVLVVVRYLAEAFGQVTVSCLQSGHHLYARPGVVSAHIYGLAVDVAALGGTPIVGHQQPGSVTERAVRDVLLLPRELQARQVISLIAMGGPSFALSNHYDHIHIGY